MYFPSTLSSFQISSRPHKQQLYLSSIFINNRIVQPYFPQPSTTSSSISYNPGLISTQFRYDFIIIRSIMNRISQPTNSRGKYQQIDTKTRLNLIELVMGFGLPISKGASFLQIPLSTAKLIIKRFRTDGSIFIRKQTQIKKRKDYIHEESGLEKKNNFLACELRSSSQNEDPILYTQHEGSQCNKNDDTFMPPLYFILYPPIESYFHPCSIWNFI